MSDGEKYKAAPLSVDEQRDIKALILVKETLYYLQKRHCGNMRGLLCQKNFASLHVEHVNISGGELFCL